jgi:hypothetical protein
MAALFLSYAIRKLRSEPVRLMKCEGRFRVDFGSRYGHPDSDDRLKSEREE